MKTSIVKECIGFTVLYFLMGCGEKCRRGQVLAVRDGRAVIDEFLGNGGCYCAIDIPCGHIWSITPLYNPETHPGAINFVSLDFHDHELSDKQKEMLKAVRATYK
jgi:hypothetical protein